MLPFAQSSLLSEVRSCLFFLSANAHSLIFTTGLLFGYDQGVVSVILVEDQFLQRFGRIADGASGAGFWKGLLTAMIELGALIGALNQGWIADKYSRKYSIVIATCVFTVGSALQTGAVDYPMLVVARFHRRPRYWHAQYGCAALHFGDLAA